MRAGTRQSCRAARIGTTALAAWAIVMPLSPCCAADGEMLTSLRAFADNLIEEARDRYGPKETPLFVSQFDIDTGELPPADSKLYQSDDLALALVKYHLVREGEEDFVEMEPLCFF